jgi:hypothetical protein
MEQKLDIILSELREFKGEMGEFKTEMYEFKDNMLIFKKDMLVFKHEMREFQVRMYEFKDNMEIFKEKTEQSFEDLFGLSRLSADFFQDHEERLVSLENSD